MPVGAGAVSAGRGPRPEVIGAGELLRQQGGADDFAVACPPGCRWPGLGNASLGDDRDDERIDDAGHEGPQDRLPDGLDNEL